MHPVGSSWVDSHEDAAENGLASCRACHGADDRGTVLSRAFADRTLKTRVGTKTFAAGTTFGCYTCHNGPGGEGNPPGGGTPTPTPRGTTTPGPSATPTVGPTRTPSPVQTSTPTRTPTVGPTTAPTRTGTPRPTATPTPTRRSRHDGDSLPPAGDPGVEGPVPVRR
jgi:hypothetical protein